MSESSYYPLGTEFDSTAPYNQSDQTPIEVDVCISQTLHKSTTISTTDYITEEWEDCERGDDGKFITTRRVNYDFSDSNLLEAYKIDNWTIPELLNELKNYIQQDLDKGCSKSKESYLKRMIAACEDWELDEEEVIKE